MTLNLLFSAKTNFNQSQQRSKRCYLGSADLAYQQTITNGTDIIDFSLQMTKDGIVFRANTAYLIAETTVVTKFISRTSNVPELQPKNGFFSLT
ncbi:glycerophosphoryl diester phosphodiesterase-like protein, putative [Medicago truncatula]|uniref:glycerophosphodiester phosphodiesterase n=1 Tax=Medicago truncatula TaxID=3880 RepID=A0A072U9E4_MEDTR|nr:glycerophosphoryl diester phosphodiesterase-like protein, putative [Medicago truncatula]